MNDNEEVVRVLKSIECEILQWRKDMNVKESRENKLVTEIQEMNKNLYYVRDRLTEFNRTLNEINNKLN